MSKNPLVKNVFSLGVVQVANYVFPLITIPIVSRIVGPDKLGVINFASAIVAYFVMVISYGFDLTATREIAQNPDDLKKRNEVFSTVFFSQCLLFLFTTVCFICLVNFMPQLKNELQVAVFTYLLCISTVFTQNWLFMAMQNLTVVAVLNVITKAIFTVLIVVIIREKKDYIWQPLAISVAQIVVSIISFKLAVKKYHLVLIKVKLTKIFSLLYDQKMVFFSLVVINFYTNTNIVILGLFQSSQQVGFYTAGQKLISIIQSVIAVPLSQALYPFIGKAFSESYTKGLGVAQKLLSFIIFFAGTAGIVLWFLGPLLIKFFYGHAFEPTIYVFRILAFIPLIIAISNVFGLQVMLNLKMDKAFFRITASAAVLSILLNFILVRNFGFIGSAYTSLGTEVYIVSMMYMQLRRQKIQIINLKYFNIYEVAGALKLFTQKYFQKKV